MPRFFFLAHLTIGFRAKGNDHRLRILEALKSPHAPARAAQDCHELVVLVALRDELYGSLEAVTGDPQAPEVDCLIRAGSVRLRDGLRGRVGKTL